MGDTVGGVTNAPALGPLLTVSRIIYVDAQRGRDHYTGGVPVAVDAAEGPKQTIRAGLAAAQPGGLLVIAGGHYPETVNLVGRSVATRIEGVVDLRRVPYAMTTVTTTQTPTTIASEPFVPIDPRTTTTTAPMPVAIPMDPPPGSDADHLPETVTTTTTTTTLSIPETIAYAAPAIVTTIDSTTTTTAPGIKATAGGAYP